MNLCCGYQNNISIMMTIQHNIFDQFCFIPSFDEFDCIHDGDDIIGFVRFPQYTKSIRLQSVSIIVVKVMTSMHKIDKLCEECTTYRDIAIATFLNQLSELKECRTRWVDDKRIQWLRQSTRIMSDIKRVFIIVLSSIRVREHSELEEHATGIRRKVEE